MQYAICLDLHARLVTYLAKYLQKLLQTHPDAKKDARNKVRFVCANLVVWMYHLLNSQAHELLKVES